MATTGLSHLVFSVWFVWDCVHQFNEEFAEYRGGAFGFFFFVGQVRRVIFWFCSYLPSSLGIRVLCSYPVFMPHIVMSPVMRLSYK